MARSDLESLIIKCLRRVYPSADFTRGSSVWTQVIDPIAEFVGPDTQDLQTRTLLRSLLRTSHPGIAIDRSGEIDDLLLKPAETLLAPFARSINQIRLRQSRADLSVHTLESLSELAANYNITPRAGDYARTSVRVYYAAPANVRVTPESYFETGTGLRYYAIGVQQISSAQMSLNMEGDLYYWDVRVMAERPGTGYNVEPGVICRAPADGRAVRVANLYRVASGRTADTVEDLAWEMDQYPCVQQIGTPRGTTATILKNLTGARVLEITGMGDPQMERDVIRGGEVGSSVATVGGVEVVGQNGTAIPDDDWDFMTPIMEDTTPPPAPPSFGAAIGYSTGEVDGWWLIMNWDGAAGPVFRMSKITYIESAIRVRIEDDVIPVTQTDIRWALVPAQLTLSQIPGGILWEDTPDGEVAIRDDEIHVGACTDVHVLGSDVESSSSDVTALDDEEELGYGLNAQTLGAAVADFEEWILLLDAPETTVLGPAVATKSGVAIYRFGLVPWATTDLSRVRAGQVFYAPDLAAAPRKFLILDVQKFWDGLVWVLEVRLDADPGPTPIANVRIINRKMGIGYGTTALVLSNAGAAPEGTHRLVVEFEGLSTDADPALIALGFPVNEGCVFRVRSTQQKDAATGMPWRIIDDLDVDLVSPKVERVSGTDMETHTGVLTVMSPTTNFQLYGVAANDVLRIESGPDAGDYTVSAAPSGPGHHTLTLDRPLTSTQIVRFRVFQGLTPVNLPLVSVTDVGLLDQDGNTLDVTVPYGEALGAYGTQFTNLNRGTKYETVQAILGIHGKNGFPTGGVDTYNPATHPIRILVWHEQLRLSVTGTIVAGERPLDFGTNPAIDVTLNAGGPFDLAIPGGRAAFANAINDVAAVGGEVPLIYPHAAWVEIGGLWYFTFRPMGAAFAALVFPSGSSVLDFSPTLPFTDYGYGATFAGMPLITTADVWIPGLSSDASLWTVTLYQDLLYVMGGPNAEHSDVMRVMTTHASAGSRFRLMGEHALYPEWRRQIRLGVPSSGLGHVYLRDPTDVEVDSSARFTAAEVTDGEAPVYYPDPMLRHPRDLPLGSGSPPPEHLYPDDLDVAFSGAVYSRARDLTWTIASTNNFVSFGVRPGDILNVLYRDQIFWYFGWPYVMPAPGQSLTITTEGTDPVTVTFGAGNWTANQVRDRINDVYGSTIALVVEDPPATFKVRIRSHKELFFSGTAVAAFGILEFEEPNVGLAEGSNRALSYGTYEIAYVYYNSLIVYGTLNANDGATDFVQYQILRPGVQRFTAEDVLAGVSDGGLYRVDVELLSRGVGDSFNIEEGEKLTPSGVRCRGYRLTTENSTLSYSMRERPWMRLDNWFQLTTAAADRWAYDQALVGAGVRITYDRSPLTASIQSLLGGDQERDTLQSVLARHLYPYYVNFIVSYAGGSLESVTLPQVEALITGRPPSEPLDVSDIIGLLSQYGADHVDTPVRLAVVRHQADRSLDVLIGDDRVETPRLCGFLPGNITLTRRP